MITTKLLEFKKPNEICHNFSNEEIGKLHINDNDFTDFHLNEIREFLKQKELTVRVAKVNDIDRIIKFIADPARNDKIHTVSPFEVYRFITYGHIVLFENTENKIIGTGFEHGYDNALKTSYTKRIVISEMYQGQHLAEKITMYCGLLAMKRGSKERRGLVNFDNMNAHYIHINHSGNIYDDFVYLSDNIEPHFMIVMPLLPYNFFLNKVDYHKIKNFCMEKTEKKDFVLVDYDDLEGVIQLYKQKEFKIAAVALKGILGSKHKFLALSNEMLRL